MRSQVPRVPHRSSVTSNVSHETGGGFDRTRRARRNEDRAFVQSGEDAIQVERHFAEPADVRSNPTAALAPGKLGWRIVGSIASRCFMALGILVVVRFFAQSHFRAMCGLAPAGRFVLPQLEMEKAFVR